LLFYNAVYVIP